MKLFVVNAFTAQNMGGNPAGVIVLDKPCSPSRMQAIAAEAGFSETAFVLMESDSTQEIRFFTPQKEVALCGHATIASYALLIQQKRIEPGQYKMKTKAGPQRIKVTENGYISMSQNKPEFGAIIPRDIIAPCLGLHVEQLDPKLPVQIASTGLFKIFVPIRSLVDILSIRPNYESISNVAQTYGAIGMYCYTLESLQGATAHCRNFAPVVGILEDSATGTSAAALSCLLHHFGLLPPIDVHTLTYEQGYSINVPAELVVHLKVEEESVVDVQVAGKATVVHEEDITSWNV